MALTPRQGRGVKFPCDFTDSESMLRPLRRHARVRAVASALAVAIACVLQAAAAQALMISEVMFNPVGGFFGNDDGLE